MPVYNVDGDEGGRLPPHELYIYLHSTLLLEVVGWGGTVEDGRKGHDTYTTTHLEEHTCPLPLTSHPPSPLLETSFFLLPLPLYLPLGGSFIPGQDGDGMGPSLVLPLQGRTSGHSLSLSLPLSLQTGHFGWTVGLGTGGTDMPFLKICLLPHCFLLLTCLAAFRHATPFSHAGAVAADGQVVVVEWMMGILEWDGSGKGCFWEAGQAGRGHGQAGWALPLF